jgi:hypothetical protein
MGTFGIVKLQNVGIVQPDSLTDDEIMELLR